MTLATEFYNMGWPAAFAIFGICCGMLGIFGLAMWAFIHVDIEFETGLEPEPDKNVAETKYSHGLDPRDYG